MPQPKYFIGIGGTGIGVANKIYDKITAFYTKDSEESQSLYRVFGLDGEVWHDQMRSRSQYCWTGKFSPAAYVEELQEKKFDVGWWPIPLHKCADYVGTAGLGQRRPQGMLGLIYHLNRSSFDPLDSLIGDLVVTAHKKAMAVTRTRGEAGAQPTIFLAGSLCGGTGAGIMIPLAVYLRRLFRDTNVRDIRIIGIALLPETQVGKPKGHQRYFEANTYAFLWENSFWSRHKLCGDREYSYRFLLSDKKPFRAARKPPQPFDLLYLVDGSSLHGQYLDHYSEYEQLAADFVFDLEYSTEQPVLVNIAMTLQEDENVDRLGGGGKSILRYPILKHQDFLARKVIEEYLEEAVGLTSREARESGAEVGSQIWSSLRDALLSQEYDRPITRHGSSKQLVAPAKLASQLGAEIEGADSDNYSQVAEKTRVEWERFRAQVTEHISVNAEEELRRDWRELHDSILRRITGEEALSWGQLDAMLQSISSHLRRTADELQKERDRKTSQVEKLTRELERDIEGFTKAFESLWHRARRGPARESLERTFKSLLSAYWRGRTLTADIEHLQNLDARLQSTLILSMNYLRECLRNSSFPDFDEDDIYIKTEVVTEVLSSPHVAESAYRAMKEKGAGSESLLTGARHRIRSVLGHFSVDRIMSFVEEGRELTPKLTTLWGIALRKEMLRSLEGNFTGLLDISVWDAIAREAQENGREIASYVSDLLARTSRKAAPFVSLVNTAGPQKHGYVLYNKPAWEKFYTDKLGGGGKKAPKLHDYLSGGGSGEDLLGSEQESGGDEEKNLEVKTLDPRLPGNPYEVMFFSVLAGFVPDELDRNQVWKDSAVWAQQQKGREIFLDTGITEKAVSQDRQNYARLIFLLAEQFKLIESAGAVYKYRKNNLETGLRGREAVIQWFVSEASQTRLAVAADLTEEWRQHPPKNRKELFTKLRKSLESKRDNPKTPKYLKEVYAADVKIVDWAIEQDAYSTAAFTF